MLSGLLSQLLRRNGSRQMDQRSDSPVVAVAPHPSRALRALGGGRRKRTRKDRRAEARYDEDVPDGSHGPVRMLLVLGGGDARLPPAESAAAAAHAAVALYRRACEVSRRASATICARWHRQGARNMVLATRGGEHTLEQIARAARAERLKVVTVRDDKPGRGARSRLTAVGIGPASEEQLAKITGGLVPF